MTTADILSKEAYDLLLAASHCANQELSQAYYQLRQLLERVCQWQMEDSSLQLTDLSARITYVASKHQLTIAEQNRLHTFRLTSNAILNEMVTPKREDLLRDAKTLAFLIQKLTHVAIPEELKVVLPTADNPISVYGILNRPPLRRSTSISFACSTLADKMSSGVNPVNVPMSESNDPALRNDSFALFMEVNRKLIFFLLLASIRVGIS